MELKALKDLIKNTESQRNTFNQRYHTSIKYYKNENDITIRTRGESKIKEDGGKKDHFEELITGFLIVCISC